MLDINVEWITRIVLWIMAILLGLTVHEYAHAKYADWAGDPTPRSQGRVTLNPLAHLDPLGTLLIIFMAFSGYGIGWGKPVLVNPAYFRHFRRDWIMVALWGPLSNLLLATLSAFLLRGLISAGINPENNVFIEFLLIMVLTNVGLAVFNMVPLHPLDGSRVVAGFLPDVLDRRYWYYQTVYGPVILLVALLVLPLFDLPNPLFRVLDRIEFFIVRHLLGL
ncbi:MAG: site-2 protease family protein [Armatimonadota bacterium]|nr:site-2 protease family protein [Armatimonadota bacterium]